MKHYGNLLAFFCCSLFLSTGFAQTPPATEPAKAPAATPVTAPAPARPAKLKMPEPPAVPAQKFDDVFQSLDYPELQVVPSASERLRIQASEESKTGWYAYWPVQVSSATLLTTALMSSSHYDDKNDDGERDDAKRNKNISIAVGSTWIIGTTIMAMYRPYRSGLKKVSEFPASSRADRLRRERLAEEYLQYPGEVASKLKYIAFGTNLLASLSMMPYQDNSGQVIVGVSALASFLPLIFDTTYESTWEKHLEYKRRIYVPVVGFNSGYLPTPGYGGSGGSTRFDQLTMTWAF